MGSSGLMGDRERGTETLNTEQKQEIASHSWVKKGVEVHLSLMGH